MKISYNNHTATCNPVCSMMVSLNMLRVMGTHVCSDPIAKADPGIPAESEWEITLAILVDKSPN